MAFPVLLFNSSTGNDTTSSGAGPGTSISGSVGRTRNFSAQTLVGFFGATDDFSGVSTAGDAVLYLAIATAGQRNFSAITAIKNTRQTGTDAAITSGTASLTVGSTAGWTTTDLIKVAGAGAAGADLYTTVTVTGGTTATLTDNASTTVGPSAAWENPKQATLATGQGVNTGTTDTAWAIGGKRLTLFGTNSLKLFTNNSASGDLMEGWIAQMDSGYTETRASAVDVRRNMTSTTGGGVLRGEPGAATLPILTFSNNSNALVMRGTYWTLQDFELRNTNATKTASVAIIGASTGSTVTVQRVVIAHSTDKFWKAITPVLSGWSVRDCNLGFCANVGIESTSIGFRAVGNWIHDCGSHGISSTSSTATCLLFAFNLIETNAGDGLHFTDTGGVGVGSGYIFLGNTIASNSSDGIEFTVNVGTTDRPVEQAIFLNNIFASNGAYGINFSGSGWDDTTLATAMQVDISYNAFYLNTSNPLSGSLTLPSTNQSGVDPLFADAANADYSLGLAAMSGAGFPGDRFLGANQSASRSWATPGAVIRRSLDVVHIHLPSA